MPKKPDRRGNNLRAEWIAAGIGAALVLASIAVLLYGALTSDESPPRLSVRVMSIAPAGEQFLVVMEVANEGSSTAADARIVAELRQGGATVEQSETTIDYVPPGSKRQAGVYFRRDPRALELALRPSGYREP